MGLAQIALNPDENIELGDIGFGYLSPDICRGCFHEGCGHVILSLR